MRILWHPIIAASSLVLLVLSVSSNADEYNFFFPKKSEKKIEKQEEEKVPEVNEAKKEEKTPIVIYNHNNVGTSEEIPTAGLSAAPSQPPSRDRYAIPSRGEVSAAFSNYRKSNRWMIGTSGFVHWEDHKYKSISQGQTSEYTSRRDTLGALVNLGYNFTPRTSFNLYAGLRDGGALNDTFAGVDVNYYPLQFSVAQDWRLLELGVLAGGSTLAKSPSNWGTLHIGGRFNFNVLRDVGLNAVVRGNGGFASLEIGIHARI